MKTRKTKFSKVNESSCPKCGSENSQSFNYSDTVDFRGLELDVENLQETKCKECEGSWVTDAQLASNNILIRSAYAIQRDKLREMHGLLSGNEIAKMRNDFSLNQREAASLFGGGYNAFNKYESGEVLQSFAMDRLLRLSVAVGRPAIEFLKDVSVPPRFVVTTRATMSTEFKISVSPEKFQFCVTGRPSGTNVPAPYIIMARAETQKERKQYLL